jgi:hypothetical protein
MEPHEGKLFEIEAIPTKKNSETRNKEQVNKGNREKML